MFSQTSSLENNNNMNENNININNEFEFEAEISEAQRLIPMLRAIQLNTSIVAVMAITCRGLKMTCQESNKCLQTTSFIDRSLFNEYYMSCEEMPITVSFRLSDLLNVLTIFCSSDQRLSHTLKMTYSSHSEELRLYLRDETIATKAFIKTFNTEELMVFNMNFVNKIILSKDSLIDFWKSVDVTSDCIQISIHSREPWLQFSTESERSKVNYNIDRESEDIEQYQCSQDVTNKYKLSLLKTSLKALIQCSKLSMRTDSSGLLSLQFMIRLNEGHQHDNQLNPQLNDHCFVEYFIVPQLEINNNS